MCEFLIFVLKFGAIVSISAGARILAVFPAPFFSHQSVFSPLTQELANRGHEVVIITPAPAFKNIDSPKNLKEIDVREVSAFIPKKNVFTGNQDEIYDQLDLINGELTRIFEAQIKTDEVQRLVNDKDQHFDLLILEACVKPALVFSYIFKAPVILISSLGTVESFAEFLGLAMHPILYPTTTHQRLYNLTLLEKVRVTYKHYIIERMFHKREATEHEILQKNFGKDVPTISELRNNVAMAMINVHHVWEANRPVPPNVIYLGGLHLYTNHSQDLPPDLETYLNSSTNGVIYMSMGTLVLPSQLPKNHMQIILRAFSTLPYDVLLRWDEDHLSGCPNNVKLVKWVPQAKLLSHPSIKLFIMQGGLQSTDEAIEAGVPIIGIPILIDQWFNVEKYVYHKIGLRIDLETVTVEKILHSIKTVIEDESYRRNIIALRDLLHDQPQNSLERAVWWTEYILRNGKTSHIAAAAAHISTWEYLEMELVLLILACSLIIIACLVFGIFNLIKCLDIKKRKLKKN